MAACFLTIDLKLGGKEGRRVSPTIGDDDGLKSQDPMPSHVPPDYRERAREARSIP
jgi:hypothetical protein